MAETDDASTFLAQAGLQLLTVASTPETAGSLAENREATTKRRSDSQETMRATSQPTAETGQDRNSLQRAPVRKQIQRDDLQGLMDSPGGLMNYLNAREGSYCLRCFRKAPHPLRRCPICKVARYCSELCSTEDWDRHCGECPIWIRVRMASLRSNSHSISCSRYDQLLLEAAGGTCGRTGLREPEVRVDGKLMRAHSSRARHTEQLEGIYEVSTRYHEKSEQELAQLQIKLDETDARFIQERRNRVAIGLRLREEEQCLAAERMANVELEAYIDLNSTRFRLLPIYEQEAASQRQQIHLLEGDCSELNSKEALHHAFRQHMEQHEEAVARFMQREATLAVASTAMKVLDAEEAEVLFGPLDLNAQASRANVGNEASSSRRSHRRRRR